jgi:hypothetical protein
MPMLVDQAPVGEKSVTVNARRGSARAEPISSDSLKCLPSNIVASRLAEALHERNHFIMQWLLRALGVGPALAAYETTLAVQARDAFDSHVDSYRNCVLA